MDLRWPDLLLIGVLGVGLTHLLSLGMSGVARAISADLTGQPTVILTLVLSALLAQAGVVVGAVYLVAVRWRGLGWRALGLRPARPGWYTRSALLAVLVLPGVMLINLTVAMSTGEAPANPQLGVVAPVGFNWYGYLGMLLVTGLFAPFAEELAFRGVLYLWLRERIGIPSAMGLSALLFSLLHGILWLVPAITLLGILLAWVYERSGSLWPAVVTHGVFNALNTTVLYASLAGGGTGRLV